MKRVVILHPGDMGSAIGRALVARGFEVRACLDGRSDRTRANARAAGFTLFPDLEVAVRGADLVISLVPPSRALEVAEHFAAARAAIAREAGTDPLYVDANSVSPVTMERIAAVVSRSGADCVDGAVLGGAAGVGAATRLLLSGPRAAEIAAVFQGCIRVEALGDALGSASALKMCFAAFNKGLVALFLETVAASAKIGQAENLLALLAEFYDGAVSTVDRLLPSYPRHVSRRIDELAEIEGWLGGLQQGRGMASGARSVFEALALTALDPDHDWTARGVVEAALERGLLSTTTPASSTDP